MLSLYVLTIHPFSPGALFLPRQHLAPFIISQPEYRNSHGKGDIVLDGKLKTPLKN